MKAKPWEYPRYDIWLFPLQHLLEIRTWGTKWKLAIDKVMEIGN
jgi:hypothetical protein